MKLEVQDYLKGILDGNKTRLAQAITLIESTNFEHQKKAQAVLTEILPFTGGAKRIGISGTPGVGKSTFIDSFGTYLTSQNLTVAILAVDPSSQKTGGSILGDKTRMHDLSIDPKAFIRPSPSAGSLGGVATKTREAMLLCEAFGFDVVIIETVGVGQSESIVSEMVDFFLLLLQPGAGDDLQGIKRGILEVAHMIAVNKADGDQEELAKRAKLEYQHALGILREKEGEWKPQVAYCSALEKTGLNDIWNVMNQYFKNSLRIENIRATQNLKWMKSLFEQMLFQKLEKDESFVKLRTQIENKMIKGELTATLGARELLSHIFS